MRERRESGNGKVRRFCEEVVEARSFLWKGLEKWSENAQGHPFGLQFAVARPDGTRENTHRHMKSRVSLLVIVSLAVWVLNSAVAQNKPDVLSSRILSLEKEWNAAYKRGDVATMNSLLADDFIITVEDGKTYSKPGYIALNGNSTVHVEVSEMSDLKVRMHGSTVAVVTGVYREQGLSKGKPYEYHDRFTDVWLNNSGKWQVIVSHYAIPSSE